MDYLRWRLRRGVTVCRGPSFTGRTLRWEELLQLPVFYWRQEAFWPRLATPPPTRTRHQVCRPQSSGGTTAASWANGLVEREGVVLLPGPLTADSQEVLAELGTGRSAPGFRPSLPRSTRPALQYLPIQQWSGSKFAETPREILWTSVTVFKMFCHRLFQEAVF